MTRSERARELARRFPKIYPDAHCELDFRNPLELLVATILSAQCTDKRVNIVTKDLFLRCKQARDYAGIPQEELEGIIRSTGFYRNKAKSLRAMAAKLVSEHDGQVPNSWNRWQPCPASVARPPAWCLETLLASKKGVVVDTHLSRVSDRPGLNKHLRPGFGVICIINALIC